MSHGPGVGVNCAIEQSCLQDQETFLPSNEPYQMSTQPSGVAEASAAGSHSSLLKRQPRKPVPPNSPMLGQHALKPGLTGFKKLSSINVRFWKEYNPRGTFDLSKFTLIVFEDLKCDAITLIYCSARQFNVKLSSDDTQLGNSFESRIKLADTIVGQAVRDSTSLARKAAAQSALQYLTSVCPTIVVKDTKKWFDAPDAITPAEVGSCKHSFFFKVGLQHGSLFHILKLEALILGSCVIFILVRPFLRSPQIR